MKPAPFSYFRPNTLDDALNLLRTHGDEAKVLAGGQSLVPLMNFRLARPQHLVDLNAINGLSETKFDDRTLTLGAMVRQRQVENSHSISARLPILSEAVRLIAHPAIRNRGTVGGSLVHADPAAELPVVAIALDAAFQLRSIAAERSLSASEFYQGYLATAIARDELLVQVELPLPPKNTGWSFMEIARRHGDFAIVAVAVLLGLDRRGTVNFARIALGGAGPVPTRVAEAENALVGNKPSAELYREAGALAAEAVDPPADIHASSSYRRHVAGVLVRRALSVAESRVNSLPSPLPSPTGSGKNEGAEGAVFLSPQPETISIALTVNGRRYAAAVEPRRSLVDFLRYDLRLVGTHVGCEHGVCGACTVMLNGKTVRSCLLFAAQVDGQEVLTIEGVATEEALHPLQRAFQQRHALQCGFCTPGMILAALELLRDNPHPNDEEIRLGLGGNLCMCTGYVNIVRAVRDAAENCHSHIVSRKDAKDAKE